LLLDCAGKLSLVAGNRVKMRVAEVNNGIACSVSEKMTFFFHRFIFREYFAGNKKTLKFFDLKNLPLLLFLSNG